MKNFLRGILVLSLFLCSRSYAMNNLHMKVLKGNHSAKVAAQAPEDRVLLTKQLFMAIINNNEESIKRLVQKGADITSCDDNGDSVLHVAWNMDSRDLIPLLLDLGADVSAKDTFGMTLLHLASNEGDVWFATYLLLEDASVLVSDKDGSTPLHLVVRACLAADIIREDALKIIVALLAEGKLDLLYAEDKQKKTVLDYVFKQPESALSLFLKSYREEAEVAKSENSGPYNQLAHSK